MRSRALACLVSAFAFVTGGGPPAAAAWHAGKTDAESVAAIAALDRYIRENDSGRGRADASVPFRIDAKLPKLHKDGVLRGLKVITGAGRVAYTQLQFMGDNLVRTAVIGRFLSAEAKLKAGTEPAGIGPANYRLSYRRTARYADRTAFVFSAEPKRRRAGLFKGELWIDTETARPLREWGELVKSPSVFLRNVYFVRDYATSSGELSVRRILIRLTAAFAGPVELTMWLDEPDAREAAGN
jgi:hypothetical protein